MAILSLVFSLIGCCLPIGLLGSLFGIFALVGISKSDGRVTGKGLAISGIIVGLITTGIQVGAFLAVQSGVGVYTHMTGTVITSIEAGDYDAARDSIDPAVTITDEQFAAFHQAYSESLGAFKRTPEGLVELVQTFSDPAIGPQMQGFQNTGQVIPIPGFFDNGTGLMFFYLDQNNPATTPSGTPAFTDVMIMLPDGTQLKLSDPVPAPETPEGGG